MALLPIFGQGTTYPTDTNVYYEAGTVILNSAPANGKPWGWVCTTAGYPGTWQQISAAKSGTVQTATAAATVSVGTALMTNSLGTGNITLQAASAFATGHEVVINNSNTSQTSTVVVASTADTLVGTATVAALGASRFMTDGTSKWYRSS